MLTINRQQRRLAFRCRRHNLDFGANLQSDDLLLKQEYIYSQDLLELYKIKHPQWSLVCIEKDLVLNPLRSNKAEIPCKNLIYCREKKTHCCVTCQLYKLGSLGWEIEIDRSQHLVEIEHLPNRMKFNKLQRFYNGPLFCILSCFNIGFVFQIIYFSRMMYIIIALAQFTV